MSEVTGILDRLHSGEAGASELLPLVYEELRRAAAARMAHERNGHTLQPTALVHEAFLRLLGDDEPRWANSSPGSSRGTRRNRGGSTSLRLASTRHAGPPHQVWVGRRCRVAVTPAV